MKNFITTLAFLLCTSVAFSQSINLFDVDASAFPTMRAKFFAFDAVGNQLRPSASELSLTEDGTPRIITNVSCPASQPPKALSSVLVIDVSGSMISQNIDAAKAAARAWVQGLPLGTSECAITSFNSGNYLNQDFTTDRNKLLSAINILTPGGGTDYDAALLNPMAGGLVVSKNGKHQKVIVFLTDGQAREPKISQIVAEANRQNCIIYCVTLRMPAPQSVKDIATRTGGQTFENVTTVKEAEDIYRTILQRAQGDNPCEIEWESGLICSSGNTNAELTLLQNGTKANASYPTPISAIARLEFNPPIIIRFDSPPIGVAVNQTVTITARNATFIISNIRSSNPAFSISPTNFILQENESRDITVSYTAADSGYTFTKFDIENDICPQTFFASGGYKGKPPSVQTLKLTHPNGGETFVVGSDTLITWEGISASDIVRLDYSTDNGVTWKNIVKEATGLQYEWKNIPKPPSTECLVRIAQKAIGTASSSNDTVRTLTGHFTEVRSVAFSPDGSTLASGSKDYTVKLWDVNTGQVRRTLTGHTNGVRSVAFSPDGSTLVSAASWDNNIRLWEVNAGQLLRILMVQGHVVWSVAFSPDGSTLASVGGDESIRLWDIYTEQELRTLTGHTSEVTSVAFSPDGSTLASGGEAIRLWDVNTGQVLRTLTGQIFSVLSVAFSPDGSTLASGHLGGVIHLWDVDTGQLLRTIRNTSQVESVAFSPDGNTLAGGMSDTIGLWDVNTGQVLRTLRGHKYLVYSVAFSPDGSTLASGGWDGTIKLWDMDTAPLQQDISDAVFTIVAPQAAASDIDMGRVLVGNSKDSVVVDVVRNIGSWKFSVDSIYFRGADAGAFSLVSGFPEYTIEPNDAHFAEFRFTPQRVGVHTAEIVIITQADTLIQNIRGEGIQPQLAIVQDFIDFGKVLVGSQKDTLQAVTIKNIGTAPLNISNTNHGMPNDVDFRTLAGGGAFTLQPGDTAKLDLQFQPSDVGRTSGVLEFHYNGVGSPAIVQLFGEGVKNSLTVVSTSINLGVVYLGEYKDTLQAITIANISEMALPITDITLNENSPFTLLSGNVPFVLQPNDTATLDVRFRPSEVGTFTDTVRYIFNGFDSPAEVLLFGRGIPLPAEALLAINDISAFAGDTISVPILLQQQQHLSANDISAFSLQLFFNPTLLFPLDSPFERLDYNTARLLLTAPISGRDTLASVRFKVGLGNAEQSPLQLTDVTAIGGTATITTQSGKFTLLGVCYEGGTRLLNPDRAGGLRKIAPNPTRQSVKVELLLIERGLTELSLYNILGEKVRTLLYRHAEGNEQLSEEYDISDLAAGQYILVLTTPTFVNKENIYIIK